MTAWQKGAFHILEYLKINWTECNLIFECTHFSLEQFVECKLVSDLLCTLSKSANECSIRQLSGHHGKLTRFV